MYYDIYKFADHVVKIDSLHQRVHKQCKNYVCEEEPEFCITITSKDIQKELEKSKDARTFPEDYLETLAVYRKLTEYLLKYDILLFHGSVIAVDGTGYLFTAKSGTGKSTHTRLWMELFGERAVMINDDKPLLKLAGDEVIVYGTPWDGKHHLSTNTSVPLKAVCMLKRGTENSIKPADKKMSYPALLQQVYRPADEAGMQKTLYLLDKMLSSVGLYSLSCNMTKDAAVVAYSGMNHGGNEK